jgi:hypothetical protein
MAGRIDALRRAAGIKPRQRGSSASPGSSYRSASTGPAKSSTSICTTGCSRSGTTTSSSRSSPAATPRRSVRNARQQPANHTTIRAQGVAHHPEPILRASPGAAQPVRFRLIMDTLVPVPGRQVASERASERGSHHLESSSPAVRAQSAASRSGRRSVTSRPACQRGGWRCPHYPDDAPWEVSIAEVRDRRVG